jgi:hypothetical protein
MKRKDLLGVVALRKKNIMVRVFLEGKEERERERESESKESRKKARNERLPCLMVRYLNEYNNHL